MTVVSEVVGGRPIEIETIQVEPVRVRVLPDGRMARRDAARYMGKAEKTLAMWAVQGKGPRYTKVGGRAFYLKDVLDAFIRGEVP